MQSKYFFPHQEKSISTVDAYGHVCLIYVKKLALKYMGKTSNVGQLLTLS